MTRTIGLEEHCTTLDIHKANADHPLEQMYDLSVKAGVYEQASIAPAGIDDVGDGRLAKMDEAGIDVQVLSQTVPGPEELDADVAVPLAREANDFMAAAVAAHPDRFAAFATLPMPDPAAAVAEFRRAVEDLGFVGAMINGHVWARYLDDKDFWPIFELAEGHGVPIYLHPQYPVQSVVDACYSGFDQLTSQVATASVVGSIPIRSEAD